MAVTTPTFGFQTPTPGQTGYTATIDAFATAVDSAINTVSGSLQSQIDEAGVSFVKGQVAFGDASSELSSSNELTWSGAQGFKEFTVGTPLTVALLGRHTYDSSIILNSADGFQTRGRLVYADSGRPRYEWLYTPAAGGSGVHLLDHDKIVNRITVESGTNSTLHLQLHLLGDGQVSLSSTAVVSGTNSGPTRGLGVLGDVTASGKGSFGRLQFPLATGTLTSVLNSALSTFMVSPNGTHTSGWFYDPVTHGGSFTLLSRGSSFTSRSIVVADGLIQFFAPSSSALTIQSNDILATGPFRGSSTISGAGNASFAQALSAQNLTSANSVTAVTVTGTTGQFGGTVSAQNVAASRSLTISGSPVLTQVKIPSMRIPFGDASGNLTSYPGLTWNNVGTSQDALHATHFSMPITGTISDPVLVGGSTVGRTSGLFYSDAFGVFPIFTWSLQGVPTTRIVAPAFGARQTMDVGVGASPTNMTLFGRLTGTGQSVITLHNNTTSQRDALVGTQDAGSDGSVIYNTTVSGFQGYRAGSWRNFTLASGTGANIPFFTPSSSADAAGAHGDHSFDSSFMYVKTTAGWKRSALSTF